MADFNLVIPFIKAQYKAESFIPLHVPHFGGNEKKYLLETIDSTFVSSVGAYVDQFELMMQGIKLWHFLTARRTPDCPIVNH